jgi:hypothetical protein
MPKYHVHIYAVFRVRVPDVEADSPEEACQKAEQAVDLADLPNGTWVDYADDIHGFLVDEDGDTEYERSTFYDAYYVRQED